MSSQSKSSTSSSSTTPHLSRFKNPRLVQFPYLFLTSEGLKMNRKAELSFIKYCNDNNLEKVQAYLTLAEDLEVDINAVDDYGDSAAHWAASNGHTEVTRILAATGLVDWNKRNNYGWTPLHLALYWGYFEVAGIIMEQSNIDFSLKIRISGWTLAGVAVKMGSTRSVELLAEREDCDSWNIPDNDGDSPLMLAIVRKKKDSLRVLLNCPRVDPSLKDRDGDCPVMKAIKNEETAMARMLIQCPRVDLATRDSNGASLEKMARWEKIELQ